MRVGLIGHPLGHSLSATMHNAAFDALGMADWRYEPWDTPPKNLSDTLRRIRGDETIAGCNITIPHKQAVRQHLLPGDEVSDDAKAIGAINTLVKTSGKDGQPALLARNTDWQGALVDMVAHGIVVDANMRALVLGAGGAARALVYALLTRGALVHVFNRNEAAAHSLAIDMAGHGTVIALETLTQSAVNSITLIVNCTSAGMWPHDTVSPWPDGLSFPKSATLYDLIYKPRETLLMRQARDAGLSTFNGLGMLIEQGAAAFEMWTGRPAAVVSPFMRQALGE